MLRVNVELDEAISVLQQRQATRGRSTPTLRQLDNIQVHSPTHQSPGSLDCRLPFDECTVVGFRLSELHPSPKKGKAATLTKSAKTATSPNKSKTKKESIGAPVLDEHVGLKRSSSTPASPVQGSAPTQSLVQAARDIVGKVPISPLRKTERSDQELVDQKHNVDSPISGPISPKLFDLLRPNSPAKSAQSGQARRPGSSAHGGLCSRPTTSGSLGRPVSTSSSSTRRPRSASGTQSARDKVSSKYLLGSSMNSLLKLKMDKPPADGVELSPSGQKESAESTGRGVHFERWKDIKQREVTKEEAAAFWNIDLNPPPPPPVQKAPVDDDEDVSWKTPPPPPMPPGVRQLSNDLKIPLCDMDAAVRLFSKYADFPDDSEQNLYDASLHISKFQEVLCSMCNVSDIEELPPEFVEEARRTADRDRSGDIDVKEFAIWYYAYSFSEMLTLTPEEKETRQIAKKLGLQTQDVDRYKQCFDKYDTERAGAIEFDRFSALVTGLLKVPAGHALPPDRLMSMWRGADVDGGGTVDFEEFCVFYKKTFDSDGGDAILDYYRNIRKVPMVV
eukprot:TRINITY_DN5486_c0_g2_i1.p1 TRINITY_DN5486_c0_g2~~TRINITY_DN5486_c0_g2_i1.p1  ORF type:complete len:561 (-),score=81.64 TRINITY_DN5486_c0_g2_i1:58-1740(-)